MIEEDQSRQEAEQEPKKYVPIQVFQKEVDMFRSETDQWSCDIRDLKDGEHDSLGEVKDLKSKLHYAYLSLRNKVIDEVVDEISPSNKRNAGKRKF